MFTNLSLHSRLNHALKTPYGVLRTTPSFGYWRLSSLHGSWIDANQDADDIHEEIQEMLTESPEPVAEEWSIHDLTRASAASAWPSTRTSKPSPQMFHHLGHNRTMPLWPGSSCDISQFTWRSVCPRTCYDHQGHRYGRDWMS